MGDILFFPHYRSFALGVQIEVPHEKITMITVSFAVWSAMIIIGAKYGGKR